VDFSYECWVYPLKELNDAKLAQPDGTAEHLGTGSDLNVISYTTVGPDGHMISLLDIGPGTLVTPDRVDRFVGSLEGALVTIFFCHVVTIRIFMHPLHREGVGILIDTGHLAGNRSARWSYELRRCRVWPSFGPGHGN